MTPRTSLVEKHEHEKEAWTLSLAELGLGIETDPKLDREVQPVVAVQLTSCRTPTSVGGLPLLLEDSH